MVTLETLAQDIAELKALLLGSQPKQYRMKDLPALTRLSRATLERYDAKGFLPGRRKRGKIVTYSAQAIHAWLDKGMPLVKQR